MVVQANALRGATTVTATCGAGRAHVGYLDFSSGEAHEVMPHNSRPGHAKTRNWPGATAPFGRCGDRTPGRAPSSQIDYLLEKARDVFAGMFVFVISDFLGDRSKPRGGGACGPAAGISLPVIVQDPTWEQSFPASPGSPAPGAPTRRVESNGVGAFDEGRGRWSRRRGDNVSGASSSSSADSNASSSIRCSSTRADRSWPRSTLRHHGLGDPRRRLTRKSGQTKRPR